MASHGDKMFGVKSGRLSKGMKFEPRRPQTTQGAGISAWRSDSAGTGMGPSLPQGFKLPRCSFPPLLCLTLCRHNTKSRTQQAQGHAPGLSDSIILLLNNNTNSCQLLGTFCVNFAVWGTLLSSSSYSRGNWSPGRFSYFDLLKS